MTRPHRIFGYAEDTIILRLREKMILIDRAGATAEGAAQAVTATAQS